ncbi:PREDICTED: coiled-coil-helix-coiled-coil-helix domain-containing protein 7 [Vollenhovia emeryi]|uniref:coiled-coil-helix-coiled-coil-helix domain-containing protein 7 n=1 Tax=Vollenhovia emeryi TaxID=411798 RepID=UPI0005F3F874|nr:PREDICTED: coiled-coil-helix-coiled-coil-helix domain-containing protein 7 [Vollenhovia emeryi]
MDARSESSGVAKRPDAASTRTLRRNQETDNPCYKEHLQSLRCLDSNQTDRSACEPYFVNYKNCKKFWNTVREDRKLKGIKPYLPPLEERVKIKADFLNSKR